VHPLSENRLNPGEATIVPVVATLLLTVIAAYVVKAKDKARSTKTVVIIAAFLYIQFLISGLGNLDLEC
jgi:heme/copper-type cytochrome/quinol oxidase subunit 4